MKKQLLFLFLLVAFVNSGFAWWNDSYNQRELLLVNDTTGEISGAWQVFYNLTYQTGMNLSFTDLRVIDYNDDTTELDYWLQDPVDGQYTGLWIEVLNTTGGAGAYVYFDYNDTPTSYSNGTSVFLEFNFENGNYNLTGDWINGTIGLNVESFNNRTRLSNDTSAPNYINTLGKYSDNTSIVWKASYYNPSTTDGFIGIGYNPADLVGDGAYAYYRKYYSGHNNQLDAWNGSTTYSASEATTVHDVVYNFELSRYGFNTVLDYDLGSLNITNGYTNASLSLGIELDAGEEPVYVDMYYLFVRNITSSNTEVDVVSQGVEHQNTITSCGSVINTTGTYFLDSDIDGSGSPCIQITSADVVLDCQGNSITYYGGKAVSSENTNITIQNCLITQNQTAGSPNEHALWANNGVDNYTAFNNTVTTYYYNSNTIDIRQSQGHNISYNTLTVNTNQTHPIRFENVTESYWIGNHIYYDDSSGGQTYGALILDSANITIIYNDFHLLNGSGAPPRIFFGDFNEGHNISYNFFEMNDSTCVDCPAFAFGGAYGVTPNYAIGNTILQLAGASSNGINYFTDGVNGFGNEAPIYFIDNFINLTGAGSHGFDCTQRNYMVWQNNYIETTGSSSSHGLVFSKCNNSIVDNNTFVLNQANGGGIRVVSDVFTNQTTNFTIQNNNITTTDGHGIYVQWAKDSTVYNNDIIVQGANDVGIYTWEAQDVVIDSNRITNYGSGFASGILVLEYENTDYNIPATITNNVIDFQVTSPSIVTGIDFEDYIGNGASLYNNLYIYNNTITGNPIFSIYTSGDWTGTLLTDNNYGFEYANITATQLAFENSTYGKVNFTTQISVDNQSLNNGIQFSDLSIHSDFNYSANITFYNVGDRGFTYPTIYRDGIECTTCTIYGSLTDTNVTIGVTGFSTYTIGDMNINVTIYSPTNTTYTDTTITKTIDLNVSTNITADTWWYELDGNGTNITFTPNSSIVVDDNTHYIDVWVNDSSNRIGGERVYFTYDRQLTIGVNIDSPANTTYTGTETTQSINLNVSANYTIDSWWYEYDSNGTNTTFTPNTTLTVDVGNHNLTVWANETGGLENSNTIYFTYDRELTIGITVYEPQNLTYTASTLTADIGLNVSANYTIDSWWYEYDSNGTNTTFTPNTTLTVDVGNHNLTVWANETGGLENSNTIIYFTYEQSVTPVVTTGFFGIDLSGATQEIVGSFWLIIPFIIVGGLIFVFRDSFADMFKSLFGKVKGK